MAVAAAAAGAAVAKDKENNIAVAPLMLRSSLAEPYLAICTPWDG